MKRNCRYFSVNKLIEDIPELYISDVEIWIDEENARKILEFIFEKNKDGKYLRVKKFQRILSEALKGRYSDKLYAKEEVSQKAKNITAMKFTQSLNHRVICKEIKRANKKIIMCILFQKKTQYNDKKIIELYETVGAYEYDFK